MDATEKSLGLCSVRITANGVSRPQIDGINARESRSGGISNGGLTRKFFPRTPKLTLRVERDEQQKGGEIMINDTCKCGAIREMSNTVWILTEEHNEYDQYGEYFIKAFRLKPTHQQLSECGVPTNRLRHTLNGGGRVDYERSWFFLKEIDLSEPTIDDSEGSKAE